MMAAEQEQREQFNAFVDYQEARLRDNHVLYAEAVRDLGKMTRERLSGEGLVVRGVLDGERARQAVESFFSKIQLGLTKQKLINASAGLRDILEECPGGVYGSGMKRRELKLTVVDERGRERDYPGMEMVGDLLLITAPEFWVGEINRLNSTYERKSYREKQAGRADYLRWRGECEERLGLSLAMQYLAQEFYEGYYVHGVMTRPEWDYKRSLGKSGIEAAKRNINNAKKILSLVEGRDGVKFETLAPGVGFVRNERTGDFETQIVFSLRDVQGKEIYAIGDNGLVYQKVDGRREKIHCAIEGKPGSLRPLEMADLKDVVSFEKRNGEITLVVPEALPDRFSAALVDMEARRTEERRRGKETDVERMIKEIQRKTGYVEVLKKPRKVRVVVDGKQIEVEIIGQTVNGTSELSMELPTFGGRAISEIYNRWIMARVIGDEGVEMGEPRRWTRSQYVIDGNGNVYGLSGEQTAKGDFIFLGIKNGQIKQVSRNEAPYITTGLSILNWVSPSESLGGGSWCFRPQRLMGSWQREGETAKSEIEQVYLIETPSYLDTGVESWSLFAEGKARERIEVERGEVFHTVPPKPVVKPEKVKEPKREDRLERMLRETREAAG